MKKPVLKKKNICKTIEYWDCGTEGHHHETIEVAERCMAKRAKIEAKGPRLNAEQRLVRATVSALAIAYGSTFKAAGDLAGVNGITAKSHFRKIIVRTRYTNYKGKDFPDFLKEAIRYGYFEGSSTNDHLEKHRRRIIEEIKQMARHEGVFEQVKEFINERQRIKTTAIFG